MNSDLDQTIPNRTWVRDNPVYCPVPWCSAHNLRHTVCGDEDGDYDGIHIARIEYAPKFRKLEGNRVDGFVRAGLTREGAVLVAASARTRQDMVDSGLIAGRKGRRRL